MVYFPPSTTSPTPSPDSATSPDVYKRQYSSAQEIYFDFIPYEDTYVSSGIWRFRLNPQRLRQGSYDLWLPSAAVLNPATAFLRPSPEITLTIPSTSCLLYTSCLLAAPPTHPIAQIAAKHPDWRLRVTSNPDVLLQSGQLDALAEQLKDKMCIRDRT